MPKSRTPQKRNLLPFIISGLICILAVGIFLIIRYMPSWETVNYREASGLSSRDYFMVGGEPMTEIGPPLIKDDALYIPIDFIKSQLDFYIFWDGADRVSITTPRRVIRMSIESLDYYENNERKRLDRPIYEIDAQAYLPAAFIEEFYGTRFEFAPESGFAIVVLPGELVKTASVTKKASVRSMPDIKSPIVESVAKDIKINLLEENNSDTKFIKVRTENNAVGYISANVLTGLESSMPMPPKPEELSPPLKKPIEGKITMMWDQILRHQDNSKSDALKFHPGLDVLSPTWFSFDEEKLNGDIISIADKSYVDWAHENGYQVWALITDNFKGSISHAVLSNTTHREHVIDQLLQFTDTYNLDGINIDFEAVRSADIGYFHQFLRELWPLLRHKGASLSVDVLVPFATKYYNRTEIGKVVDYVCVMTYDEHWSGSETSGPVASLPFVNKGITDTLLEVPKEKILMGIPFYVRVWREVEQDGQIRNTIRNYAIDTAYNIFNDNGAKFTWLSDIGSYYAEYTAVEEGETVTYRTWLEDLRSIGEKLNVASNHDVAGITAWRRGLQSDEVWDSIAEWKARN